MRQPSKRLKKKSQLYFVYILECKDKTLYTGYTKDLHKRVIAHNAGKTGAKYTKSRRPVVLKYSEKHATLSAALQREYALKQLSRADKLRLLKTKNSLKLR
jgi:putative endonuclease